MGREMHALSCGSKPVSTWLVMRAVQECREACGGHGYLKVSRLGELRDDNDPQTTYEGDNNVLLFELAKYLMSLVEEETSGNPISSPMHSADFLRNRNQILKESRHDFNGNGTESELILTFT